MATAVGTLPPGAASDINSIERVFTETVVSTRFRNIVVIKTAAQRRWWRRS